MKPRFMAITTVWFMLFVATVGGFQTSHAADVPTIKQTKLGLYVTAPQAYAKWAADPEHVTLLDVRTPDEYYWIGHAPAAVNIPFSFWRTDTKQEGPKPPLKPNPEFVDRVKRIAKPDSVVLVYCRSGERSAKASNALAEAGFTKVYSIVDGFEGDTVTEPGSVFHGKRMKNGWRNSGIPWTHASDPKQVYDPNATSEPGK
ncbi:MAG: hypothetical protein JW818_06420 [Pirellulales bacterium]|nr:hypothetical protein [Pirellulales bacterium]